MHKNPVENLRLFSTPWLDYELIDSGNGEKLERFGRFTLIRPEPQALWRPSLSEVDWSRLATARFDREQKDRYRFSDEVNGGWQAGKGMPESWSVRYTSQHDFSVQLRLALTSFGHVGIFPEQASNWDFIRTAIIDSGKGSSRPLRILNLFAYTGAASVVARQAGAEVTHVDASKPGLNWANQNMQMNGLADIRWVHEDALKFVRREVRRGNKYHGIIMDPPPYGRGPEGEKWTLQEKLQELVSLAGQLLDDSPLFFVLSLYAAGLSAQVGRNLALAELKAGQLECGEFTLSSSRGCDLPMGTVVRVRY